MFFIVNSSSRLLSTKRSKCFLFILGFSLSSPLFSADWKLSKQLALKGTYSDNIDMTDTGKVSDFFFELTPGFVLQGKGRRLNLNLAYSLQALHYLNMNSDDKINNRLQLNAESEIYQDHLFLDANVTTRQELKNALDPSGWDATNPSNDLQNTYTYLVAPYFKNRFGRQAELTIRLENDGVFYSEEGNDSLGYQANLDLLSGPALGNFQWAFISENEYIDYQDGPRNRFSTVAGGVGYQFDNRWRIDVLGGYEDNSYASTSETSGALWEGLVTWTPNNRTDVTLGSGHRYFGWTPRLEIDYRRKRSVWTASYKRDISNARTDSLGNQVYEFQDAFGETVTPDTGAELNVPVDTATPDSSVYTSNRFDSAWTLQTRRSSLGISLGYVLRQYDDVSKDEGTVQARLYWSRRLSTHTTSNLGLKWSQRERNSSVDDESDLDRQEYGFDAGLTRRLSEQAYVNVQYGFRDDGGDSTENRVTLGLRLNWQ
ncbi:TIGR03016 family PEP-CTERM system-associated outer membrane protein [Allochromatium palmeri]|uniref:TIGR03016 family PEP-CTERM system-associated outer membrane protein n=1 Tax=Allochromatium palmeri TaxID=231048 RepID=A0A6N8EC00_9GAMM|nr:TIGR03016 family PEP-CTERM system-associated outer membrane protein [Allochromatium palmeri]MTW21753.1 TIGR03016 family PEP-CTERM system-associated outer membrane protein [Allochromatium palmeri]